VRELGVGAGSDDLAADGSELLDAVREADDLSWADEGALNVFVFKKSQFR
jgi:hypothetical protein